MYDETNYTEFADKSSKSLKNHFDLDKAILDQGQFRKLVFGC